MDREMTMEEFKDFIIMLLAGGAYVSAWNNFQLQLGYHWFFIALFCIYICAKYSKKIPWLLEEKGRTFWDLLVNDPRWIDYKNKKHIKRLF